MPEASLANVESMWQIMCLKCFMIENRNFFRVLTVCLS